MNHSGSNNGGNQENVFPKRVRYAKERGYRGFNIKETRRKWGGVRLTANNNKGLVVSTIGDTGDEAYSKLIDKIDWTLETSG